MKESIKISIIMPFLNSIEYLKECMDSVINQSLKEIEIICVDAGSTDGTIEVLKEYEKNDERVVLIYSDKKSYGYQINLGLKRARGEYFGIVESDDYIKEEMYETLYGLAIKYNCDVVKSDFCRFIHENGQRQFSYASIMPIKELYNKIINPLKDLRAFKGYGLNQPGVYRMEMIKKYNIRLNETPGASYQDNGLWFQMFAQAEKVFFHDKAFYMLRRDNPNSSVKSKEKVYCMCEEYDFIRNFLKCNPKIEKNLAPICAYYRYLNYMFTLERIDRKFKLEFCKRFSNDFENIKLNGELDNKLYKKDQLSELQFIINQPEKYYFTKVYNFNNENTTLEEVINQNIAINYKIEELLAKIDEIKKSNKITNKNLKYYFDKCYYSYKNYGFKYTIKKILDKVIK